MQANDANTSLVCQWKLPLAAAPHSTPQIRGIQVTGFKMTDGSGVGVKVKLEGGPETWFFQDEIAPA